MKKTILSLLGALLYLFAVAQTSSAGRGGTLETRQKKTSSMSNTHRAPFHLPTVTYWIQYDNHTLEINSSTRCEGEIYIYNSYGVIIDYESSINAIFEISSYSSGSYLIYVSSDLWEAEGYITL